MQVRNGVDPVWDRLTMLYHTRSFKTDHNLDFVLVRNHRLEVPSVPQTRAASHYDDLNCKFPSVNVEHKSALKGWRTQSASKLQNRKHDLENGIERRSPTNWIQKTNNRDDRPSKASPETGSDLEYVSSQ